MKVLASTMRPDGELTLPDEVVRALRLNAGSKVLFSVQEGRVVMQPLLSDTLAGMQGILASDRDLVAELQQERRQDKW